MNKSNQKKYNKRIQNNEFELYIIKFNLFRINKETDYNIIQLAKDMAAFKNTSIETEINRMMGR